MSRFTEGHDKVYWRSCRGSFSLQGGHFLVANNDCLHKQDCDDNAAKKTWIIVNTFANYVLNNGDTLKLTFVASTSGQIRGVKADVKFYGYDQVFVTEGEPDTGPKYSVG